MAGLAGIIGFHEAGDGYLVTFPQGENVQALIDDYKGRLRDLENNIWSPLHSFVLPFSTFSPSKYRRINSCKSFSR